MILDLTPEEPSNIVAINADAAKQLEITKAIQERKYKCSGIHKNVIVDSMARTLTCKNCGFVVDPFDYIEQWANEGESRMTGMKEIEIKRRIAYAEHEDLMRKVKNLRQRLKRAGEPQSETERREYDRQRWNIDYPSYEKPPEVISVGGRAELVGDENRGRQTGKDSNGRAQRQEEGL